MAETVVGYNLPADAEVTVSIADVTGKVVQLIRTEGTKGYNTVTLNANSLGATGVLYYTVATDDYTATKKMIIVE